MVDCIEKTGRELNLNNQGIVKYLCGIEEERKNLELIIQKQYQERKRIEAEIERLTYKLCLINKSLSMRIKAKNNYDKTIEEIKGHYECLVESSNKLRLVVEKTQKELDDIMNKKTGTYTGPEGEEIKMLYVKPGGDLDANECTCTYQPQVPTKEKSGILSKGLKVVNTTYQETTISDNLTPQTNKPENIEQFSTQSPQTSGNETTRVKSHLEDSSEAVIEKHHSPSVPQTREHPGIKDLQTPTLPSSKTRVAAPEEWTTRKSFEHEISPGGSQEIDKNGILNQESSIRSKNMLLSRLRTNHPRSEKLSEKNSERPSTISLLGRFTPKITSPEEKTSTESRKFQKKSIDEVLLAEPPKRSSN